MQYYPAQNPYMTNPYMQQVIVPPAVQQMQQQQQQLMMQQQTSNVRVSGRDEAMNRLLMMYPANMLVPGFISEAVFDIDGRHFHALSIEADGSRNLETFSYKLDMSPGSDYVSRTEFDELVNKINRMTGGTDGISQSVQAAADSATASAGQPA